MLWGGRNTANKCHCCVFTVIQPHWVCPHSRRVCFPVYTAQTLGCSTRNCLMRALVCMHFPGKPLRFMFSGIPQRCRLGWACVLHPYQDISNKTALPSHFMCQRPSQVTFISCPHCRHLSCGLGTCAPLSFLDQHTCAFVFVLSPLPTHLCLTRSSY